MVLHSRINSLKPILRFIRNHQRSITSVSQREAALRQRARQILFWSSAKLSFAFDHRRSNSAKLPINAAFESAPNAVHQAFAPKEITRNMSISVWSKRIKSANSILPLLSQKGMPVSLLLFGCEGCQGQVQSIPRPYLISTLRQAAVNPETSERTTTVKEFIWLWTPTTTPTSTKPIPRISKS